MSRIIVSGVIVLLNIFGLTFAWFESCNHQFALQLGQSVQINSPNYPNYQYPPGSSCIYKLTAPVGTQVRLECRIQLTTSSSGSCKNEYFYIASDGNITLSNAQFYCGSGSIVRNSVYSELAMAYTSSTTTSSNSTGYFTCTATVQPVACDCGWSVSTRIVGGANANVNEYTSMVALVNNAVGSIFCGGVIISPTIMLTAAHCLDVYNISNVTVLVGESDIANGNESPYTKLYVPKKFTKHPNYSSSTYANDIGLIETTVQILFSRGVGPACLPLSLTLQSLANVIVEAAGWGTTQFAGPTSNTLKKVSLSVISNSVCSKSYPQLSQSQMCTYTPGKDTCQYDSGGPLYLRGNRLFLVGIVSLGDGCGGSTPTVHTRVTSYLGWIVKYVPLMCTKVYQRSN